MGRQHRANALARGIYQHCSQEHLHRYLAEYDFRFNHRVRLGYSDDARTAEAPKGIVGLPNEAAQSQA